MNTPRLPLDHSFGDVRALLQHEPSAPAWALLCALLDAWPGEDAELEAAVMPYVLQHTARWPRAIAEADVDLMRAGRSRRIAHRLETEALDAAQMAALRRGPLEGLRSLHTSGAQLAEAGRWPALEQLTKMTTDLASDALDQIERLTQLKRLHVLYGLMPGAAHRLPPLEGLAIDATWVELSQALVGLRAERLTELWVGLRGAPGALGTRGLAGTLRWLKREAPALKQLGLYRLHAEASDVVGLVKPGLERLSLEIARVPHQDWTALLVPAADTLISLTLWATLDHDAPNQLAALALPALRHVKLTAPRVEAERLGALCGASWMAQLETLHLSGQQLSAQAIKRLSMPRLTRLELHDCALTPDALAALLEPGRLPALRALTLTDLPLADSDVQLLAESPTCARLKELRLTSCRITAAQLELLGRAGWDQLDTLDLTASPLEGAHVEALHRAPLLRRLNVLTLDAPRVAASARLRDDATLPPLVRFACWGA